MIQIEGTRLWLGHVGDARNLKAIYDAGITSLVDLAVDNAVPTLPHELIYCRIPLLDGAGNEPQVLRAAIQTTVMLLRSGMPTLVYCGAGMSRSPAIAAAALALLSSSSPEDSLRRIATAHPMDLTSGLWQDILAALESLKAACNKS